MSTTKGQLFPPVILALGIAGFFPAASAFGAAVVQESKGDVRAGATPAESKPVAPNQRVLSGALVTTASGSQVVLRFDDGQVVALHENTQFRIENFSYRQQEPGADRAVFVLLRGALRAVSGALGKRSPDAFSLSVQTATIGIRGTDFMVASVNPAYLSVLEGTVAATNTAGTVAFGAGTFGSIATPTTLAAFIPASALPAAVSSAFVSLGALRITRAGSAAGEIDLPGTAAPGAQEASAFGLGIANAARDKGDLSGREFGQGVSGASQVRDRSLNIPSKSGRP